MAKEETQQLRQGNQALDQTKYSQEKSITEQLMLITSLKREIKDKEQICNKSQTQIDSLQTQIQSLNDTISLLKQDKQKLE